MSIYIFLDVDGVLNGFSKSAMLDPDHIWYDGSRGSAGIGGLIGIRKVNVDNFKLLYNELTKSNQVKLVLSSSWRLSDMTRFRELIELQGFPVRVWSKTPQLGLRGAEIKEFLSAVPAEDIDAIIIIDDEITNIIKYFHDDSSCVVIHTDGYDGGLTILKVQKALLKIKKILKQE